MTPTQLVKLAEEQGLSVLALTDHNTSAGLKEFMEAGKDSPVITVPGCEFSTEWEGREVHVVGLFFLQKYWQEIEDFLELTHLAKINSNISLIKKLNEAGYDITVEECKALTNGEFNRTHVARVLMAKGYVSSVAEAFDGLLKEGNGFYTPAKKISPMAAIRFIKTYGAVAIIAHPLLSLTPEQLMTLLPEAKRAGLDAIETHYTEFDRQMTRTAKALAASYGLLQSGGSDFHGTAKPDIRMGCGRGELSVPFRFYEELLKRAKDYDQK